MRDANKLAAGRSPVSASPGEETVDLAKTVVGGDWRNAVAPIGRLRPMSLAAQGSQLLGRGRLGGV